MVSAHNKLCHETAPSLYVQWRIGQMTGAFTSEFVVRILRSTTSLEVLNYELRYTGIHTLYIIEIKSNKSVK